MYDICFCQECHEEREDDDYYNRGNPPKLYALPIEWCRFGLRIRKSAPDSWHIAFHGTTPDRVLSILESGLVPAGGVTDRGEEVFERSGHFTPSRKPYSEFDTKQIFVSPTIRYAGREEYAKFGKLYFDSITGENYLPQVAFQVWIKPESYKIDRSTILDQSQIDPRFSNSELEWSTKDKNDTIVYGLLLKLSNT
jgi:hypothetical protein